MGELFARDDLFDDDARVGYVSGSPNVECSLCGYKYYMTFLEFLTEALLAGYDEHKIFCVTCRSCSRHCAYRRYFCFTCNKWKSGLLLGSKPPGVCLRCGKISFEFLRDEGLLLLPHTRRHLQL